MTSNRLDESNARVSQLLMLRGELAEKIVRALHTAIALALPTLDRIQYEWGSEYDDQGSYFNYVERTELLLKNGDSVAYSISCGDMNNVTFKTNGAEVTFEDIAQDSEDVKAAFIAAGLVDAENALYNLLNNIELLSEENGSYVDVVTLEDEKTIN